MDNHDMTHLRQNNDKSKEISNSKITVASEILINRPAVSVLFTLRHLLPFKHSSPFFFLTTFVHLMLQIVGL